MLKVREKAALRPVPLPVPFDFRVALVSTLSHSFACSLFVSADPLNTLTHAQAFFCLWTTRRNPLSVLFPPLVAVLFPLYPDVSRTCPHSVFILMISSYILTNSKLNSVSVSPQKQFSLSFSMTFVLGIFSTYLT